VLVITELKLTNFRCFKEHTLALTPQTIIVGRNNAGKSTIIEALRFVAIVVARLGALNFESVPSWLDVPARNRGVRPSLRGFDLNDKTLFYGYSDPPAIVRATFSDGETVTVYFGEDHAIHAVIEDADGRPVTTKAHAASLALPQVQILPPIGPLLKEERLLRPDYYRSLTTAPYQSIHFRNHLAYNRDKFDAFKQMASESWPGIALKDLIAPSMESEGLIGLTIRDREFSAEVGRMGHGLQMWLQIIWFLVSADQDATVILDEPDVYMHADLQRRLIRLLRGRSRQTIVATHSVEILSEVPASEILIVDRSYKRSRFALSIPAVQALINGLGAPHNIQLARMGSARKVIFVEGDDFDIIKGFHNILEPSSSESPQVIPNMSIGGWSGWPRVLGARDMMRNIGDESIKFYCVLDRDYHTEDEINEKLHQAEAFGIELHIWKRKEIENYLLSPAAIARALGYRADINTTPTEAEIEAKLDEIVEEFKNDVFDCLSNEYVLRDRRSGPQGGNRNARRRLDAAWATREGRWGIVCGKEVLRRLASWTQDTYGICLSHEAILQAMTASDLPEEVCNLMEAIRARAR
jgi:predicted ATPase